MKRKNQSGQKPFNKVQTDKMTQKHGKHLLFGNERRYKMNYDEFFKMGKDNRVFAFCDDTEYWQEKGRVADAFSLLEEIFDTPEEEKNKIRVALCHYNKVLERHFDVLHKSDKYEKEQEC